MAEQVAAESPIANSGNEGQGAPIDAPAAKSYNDAQVNAIAAKHKREGEKLGRKTLLDLHGVESEERLAEILNAHRAAQETAQAAEKPEAERKAEKLKAEIEKRETAFKAEAQKREQALQAQLDALQAEHDNALVRDVARRALGNAGLIAGAEDLIMAALGIGEPPEHRLTVKNGAVVVVDRDGDEIGVKPEDHIATFLKPRLYLHSALSASTQVQPGTRPVVPTNGKRSHKLSHQEELEEIVRAGMAHSASARSGAR